MAIASQSGLAAPSVVDGTTRHLLMNSGAMALARGAGLLTLIVAVPFLMEGLGSTAFGVWESLVAAASIVTTFQVVISGTLIWRVSAAYGRDDIDDIRRLLQVGVASALASVVVVTPITWFFSEPILGYLRIDGESLILSRNLLPTIVAVMLLGGVNEALTAVHVGFQKSGRASIIQSLGIVTTNGLAISLIFAGFGVEALLYGMIAGLIMTFAALYLSARHVCGELSLTPTLPSRRDIVEIGPFSGLLFVSSLAIVFRDHTDKIVLATSASSSAVAYFAMAQRLVLAIAQVCAVFIIPFTASVGALGAAGRYQEAGRLYANVGTGLAVVVGLLTVMLCTLHHSVFVLWVGHTEPDASLYLTILLVGYSSALILGGAGAGYVKGRGRAGLETAYSVVTLIGTLALKPILIHFLGPTGAATASAVAWTAGALLFVVLIHKFLQPPEGTVYRIVGIWALTCLLATIGRAGSDYLTIPHSRAAAVVMVGVAAVPLSIIYFGTLAALRLLPKSLRRLILFQHIRVVLRKS